jgi:hypothetical protein
MCTVSWARTREGYGLLFNRDELKTREPAIEPEEYVSKGVRYLAPIDGRHGGTWILVNEFGLTLCLLNHYPGSFTEQDRGRPSRGNLVVGCAGSSGGMEAARSLERFSLDEYPPFHLVAVSRTEAHLLTWDGGKLAHRKTGEWSAPLTSSSFETERVISYRMDAYHRLVGPEAPGMETLETFHRQHEPLEAACSVLMFRPDACTQSLTRIEVTAVKAMLHYEPQSWVGATVKVVNRDLDLRN